MAIQDSALATPLVLTDDLPQDWRFDYYAAIFKTLSLPIDTDEDLEQIFSDIEEGLTFYYQLLPF
jgi:hypothetical protein